MLPTLCDVLKIPTPEESNGLSFLPFITGDSANAKTHEFLYWETGKTQTIRFGKWKALAILNKKTKKRNIALYNLETDIEELNDVASANPEVVDRAQKYFDQGHETASPHFPHVLDKK